MAKLACTSSITTEVKYINTEHDVW